MARRNTGGFLSATEQATDANSANGIFTLQEAAAATAAGNFPTGRWTPSKALRFRNSASAYLTRTNVYPGNRKTWTYSAWVKYSNIGTQVELLGSYGTDNSNNFAIEFSSNQLYIGLYSIVVLQSNQVFRDPSAWYHVVVQLDTTQSTVTSRCRAWVNGTEITSWGTDSRSSLTQNGDFGINSVNVHNIGRNPVLSSRYFDGYMSEVNLVDGQALSPSSFGQTDPETGTWVPKRYTGTYGTNGFYLPFSTDSTSYTANVLVVGGGGGGGNSGVAGGGGGAGGYVSKDLTIVSGDSITVTVGAGGAVTTSGSNSVLGSNIGAGGGNGGVYDSISGAGSGGSGGGGGGSSGATPGTRTAGSSLYSQGNSGGSSSGNIASGAGGGGAGGAGASRTDGQGSGAAGGTGSTWSVNSVAYAGGGGGGNRAFDGGTGGAGGSGGGGRGSGTDGIAVAGTANLGGGGGGSGFGSWDYSGKAGGSGVVLIRVPDTQTLTFSAGVTVSGGTASGGYKLYTVTATSTTSETVTFS
jgi:hypothetical protein